MRRVYLIARREYLAYVTAWGFWLGILVLPIMISVSVLAPALAERSTPMRYYTVIAEDPTLAEAFQAGLERGAREAYEGAVRAAARLRGADSETERRAVEAFAAAEDRQAGLVAAAQVLGLPGASAFQLGQFRYQQVDPPARSAEPLRPYLLGDATVSTPEGPRPLHAAIFLRRAADGGIAIDYWSEALTDGTLSGLAEDAMRELMRAEALRAAGVDASAVERANDLQPALTEFNPERAAEDAEVTLADRAPIFVGLGMGIALWIVVFSVVNGLLSGVIEEKSSKVLEALLANARYHEILTGKLLGVAGVSATLLAVWGSFVSIGFALAGNAGAPIPGEVVAALLDPRLLVPFVSYFVLGYLMYGAIFLAIGSLCETVQEAQTLMTPMMLVLMIPMFVLPVAMNSPDAPFVAIMSWIPLYTPFLMMIRLPNDPSLLEVVGTTLVLAATTCFVLWGAGGVFRAGVVGRAGPGAIKRVIGGLFRRNGGRKGSEGGEGGAGALSAS